MFDPIDFDPALVGLWPLAAGEARLPDAVETKQAVEALMLEVKALVPPLPADELQALLNDMTTEMRQQFEVFRTIRGEAEARLASTDEGELKLAKADIKSATDALSLIVRTLEKLDSLQRSLARDREMAAERQLDDADYEEMLADIDRKIGERAAERLSAWLAERGLSEDFWPGQASGEVSAPGASGSGGGIFMAAGTGPPGTSR